METPRDLAEAEALFRQELADINGITRELRAQIELLEAIDIHRGGADSRLGFVCRQSTRVSDAMVRLQRARTRAANAMARLRKVAK